MRVAISNKETSYSMVIEKNNSKIAMNYVSLLEYFANSLYRYIRCNDIVLVWITVGLQTRGTIGADTGGDASPHQI